MGPFETAGGVRFTYGVVRGTRGWLSSAPLRAHLYGPGVGRTYFAVTAGTRDWYPVRDHGNEGYADEQAARAACDVFVAALYLSGEVAPWEVKLANSQE